MNNNRILLLVQTHGHAAALMDCIPHIRAHYAWVWVVYSPAVLADPAVVEKEFDLQIADLTRAMKDCYAREDGAGGDAYKGKRDAAVLDKTAKVKDAWKSLPKENQQEAFDRLFQKFIADLRVAAPGINIAVTQALDHFETAAHVEFQNSLKAGMKTGFVPGEYVVGWPTSLPKGTPFGIYGPVSSASTPAPTEAVVTPQRLVVPAAPPVPVVKLDKRTKEYKARVKELEMMSLDDLGPIAFELGVKPSDSVAGKKDSLIQRIMELENDPANVNAY